MLAVLLLRRIAYTMLALFRAVTLRSDESRATRKDLLAWVRGALVAGAPEHTMNLRAPYAELPGPHQRRRHPARIEKRPALAGAGPLRLRLP